MMCFFVAVVVQKSQGGAPEHTCSIGQRSTSPSPRSPSPPSTASAIAAAAAAAANHRSIARSSGGGGSSSSNSYGSRSDNPLGTCPFTCMPLQTLRGHSGCVTGLCVLPKQGLFLSCGLDGLLLLWDYLREEVVWRHEVLELGFRCLAVRPDASEVLVGTEQGHLLRVKLPIDEEEGQKIGDSGTTVTY